MNVEIFGTGGSILSLGGSVEIYKPVDVEWGASTAKSLVYGHERKNYAIKKIYVVPVY